MESSVLKKEAIDEIINGINELPEDKVQSLMDFFRYLIAASAKKNKQKNRVSSTAWKQATEEFL